jgi:hypothetical protein
MHRMLCQCAAPITVGCISVCVYLLPHKHVHYQHWTKMGGTIWCLSHFAVIIAIIGQSGQITVNMWANLCGTYYYAHLYGETDMFTLVTECVLWLLNVYYMYRHLSC